jgi:hypothetical protein
MMNLNKKIDNTLAVIGSLVGILIIPVSVIFAKGIGLSLTLFLSCFIYILIKILIDDEINKAEQLCAKLKWLISSVHLISSIYSIYLFNLLVLSIYLFNDSSVRPLGYFILIAISGSLIAVEVCSFSEHLNDKIVYYNIIFQIIALSSSIIYGAIVVLGLGSDQWFHANFINSTINSGHLPDGNSYTSFPIMHIGIVIINLITALDYLRNSVIAFVSSIYIIGLIFIFLIGRTIFDTKSALFATLLAGINLWYIYWGVFMVPMSFGISLFLVFIYLYYFNIYQQSIKYLILIIFVTMVSIPSHPFSSFAIVIISFIVSLCIVIYPKFYNKIEKKIKWQYLIFCIVAMLGYWMFSVTHILDQQMLCLNHDYVTSVPLKISSEKSVLNYELDHLGEYILYFIAIVGGLNWLNKRDLSFLSFSVLFSIIPFMVISYLAYILGIMTVLPHRWLIFGDLILIFPASSGMQYIINTFKIKHKNVAYFMLMLILILSMITNTMANADSPFYGKTDTVRLQLKNSEMKSAEFVSLSTHGPIYTDWLLHFYFYYYLNVPLETGSMQLIDNEIVKNIEYINGFFVIRNYIYNRPIQRPIDYLDQDELKKISDKFINKIYNNNEVSVYNSF